MSFYICLKCRKQVTGNEVNRKKELWYCLKCKEEVYEYESEKADISSEYKGKMGEIQLGRLIDIPPKVLNKYKHLKPRPINLDVLQCEEELVHHPDNIEALYFLGKYYYSMNECFRAVPYFERIMEKDDKNKHIHNLLSEIYLRLNRYDKCIQVLNNLLSIEGKTENTLCNLTITYFLNEQFKESERTLARLKISFNKKMKKTYISKT